MSFYATRGTPGRAASTGRPTSSAPTAHTAGGAKRNQVSEKHRYSGFFNERRSVAPKFSTAARFTDPAIRGAVDDGTPGPAAYNTNSSTLHPKGVSIAHAARTPLLRGEGAETPGPGAYNTVRITSSRYQREAYAHAASFPHASRGEPISRQLEVAETPGPGAYNTVLSSFARATQRSSTPRGRPANSGGGNVNLSRSTSNTMGGASRRVTAAYIDPMGLTPTFVSDDRAETPGPGAYRVNVADRLRQRHAPAAVIPRASRFDDFHIFGRRIDDDGPGVQAYAGRVVDRDAWVKGPKRATIPRAARFPKTAAEREMEDGVPGPGAYTPLYGLL